MCAIVAAIGAAIGAAPARAATLAERMAQDDLLSEINAARADRGREPLQRSRVLTRPARQQSAFVAGTGELQHEGRDGTSFHVRLYRAGFPRGRAVGENLGLIAGCDRAAAARVVGMWLASPPHRRILLSPRFRVVGVGVASDAGCDNTGYTADFGA